MVVAAGADINRTSTFCIEKEPCCVSSPIKAAAASSHTEMVKWLLAQGANPNPCCYNQTRGVAETPLSIAAAKGNLELVNILLDAGSNVHQYEDYGSSPAPALFWAVRGGSFEVVRRLLEAGANVNLDAQWRNGNRVTFVGLACKSQNASIVELLLEAGASVDQHSEFEATEPPIHTAAACGDAETIRVLARYGADVNELADGWTVLHAAIRLGLSMAKDIVKTLIFEFHADYSVPLVYGSLPIHLAAQWDQPECLEPLAQAGSDVNARNKGGRTPLHWAVENRSVNAVKWLLENGADAECKEHGTNMTACDFAELQMRQASSSKEKERSAEVLAMLKGGGLQGEHSGQGWN